jgi:hypothetical protein
MSHSGSAAACLADAGGFDPLHARQFHRCERAPAIEPADPSPSHCFAEASQWAPPSPTRGEGFVCPSSKHHCPCVAGATPTVLTSESAVRFRAWAPHRTGCGLAAMLPPSEGGDREFESRHPDQLSPGSHSGQCSGLTCRHSGVRVPHRVRARRILGVRWRDKPVEKRSIRFAPTIFLSAALRFG